ncbi:MAG: sn-glycerol-3-phosphate ABC transporter ATP-binding protein UgpC [Candidatus Competibacteraceae bacterium]|jgi:multiple sugar transport system ATP-binding protein|nr:sn-glycerol-3-phosphate ABC transporter ATP-binding protein UgpC [Candidatus Competibacteraceae bacterium]
MAAIRMHGLCKTFKDTRVVEQVNLDIAAGEFVVFVGPSGCGKSTLLRLIAGLEDISAGDLFIGDQRVNDLPPAQRGVAMVFQSYALYPHMSVFDNMAFGLKLAKQNQLEINQRVQWAAEILQIESLLQRLPKELSGGQRQRVAIGRAIVRKPQVFLFDEPLSNLDAALRVQTRLEIAKLHRDFQATMIYVTHDQVEAMTLADKIVLLNSGQAVQAEGSVAQFGPPLELYHHPSNRFVAGFIGSPKMNFLPARLTGFGPTDATVVLPDGTELHAAVDASQACIDDPVILGIRPEHIRISPDSKNLIGGEINYVEHLGEASYVYLHIEGVEEPIVVRREGDALVEPSTKLAVGLTAQYCHLFDSNGRAYRRILPR